MTAKDRFQCYGAVILAYFLYGFSAVQLQFLLNIHELDFSYRYIIPVKM